MADPHTKKLLAAVLIAALLIFLAYALLPYVKALFGAVILFALFNPLYLRLKYRMRAGGAAFIAIIASLVLVLVPAFFIIATIAGQVGGAVSSADGILRWIQGLDQVGGVDITGLSEEIVVRAAAFARDIFLSFIGGVTHSVVSLFIMYVTLYYMFVNAEHLRAILHSLIPFNDRNSQQLINEFHRITHATVVSSGSLALIQGGLIGLSMWILGIPAPLFWGFVAAVLSFLPVFGVGLVWGPAALIQLASRDYTAGIGMLIAGAFASTIDNVIRPILAKKVDQVHPLLTIIGVFIGIPFFGIIGVLVGPLMLSYLFLMMRMFKEEYF